MGSDLEAKAERVKQLEEEADAVHRLAQEHNKAGRFEEAQEAYSRMHQLEDEASQLAKEVGCVACVLGDPSCGTAELNPEEEALYFNTQPLPPWPQQHTTGAASRADGPTTLQQRAVGAVLGSLVGDAAAMGVHWIYDLGILDQLAAERAAAWAAGHKPECDGVGPSAAAPHHMPTSNGATANGTTTTVSTTSPAQQQQQGGAYTQQEQANPAAAAAADTQQQQWQAHVEREVQRLEQLRLSVYANYDVPGGQDGMASGTDDCIGLGLEFLDPPRSPFYAYPSGRNSPYGEQTMVLLCSIATRGGLNCVSYTHAFADAFGEPHFDGYRDVSTKAFLRNYARGQVPPMTGAADAQANCVARLAPLVAGWCGSDALMTVVKCATRVTQNSEAAVAWGQAGAAILERVLLGQAPSEATVATIRELEAADGSSQHRLQLGPLAAEVARNLRHALQMSATPVPDAVAQLGRNCHMPNALTSPLQVVLHMEYITRCQCDAGDAAGPNTQQLGASALAPAGPGELEWGPACMRSPWSHTLAQALGARYAQGVRAAIREGGCCASRSAYVGALLGAVAGQAGVPASWQQAATAAPEVLEAAQRICAARSSAA